MASIYLRNKTYWITYLKSGSKISFSLKTKSKTEAIYKKNQIENDLIVGKSVIPCHTNLRDAVQKYQEHCLIHNERHTINNYLIYINDFIKVANPHSIASINERMVNEYVNSRMDKISTCTANHIITYIKQFLNFCVRHNYIGANPIINIRHFKAETLPPRFLTKPEIKAVLTASSGETLEPMIATAIYTGMRLGELKRITTADIDWTRKIITVPRSKSGKFRVIPAHKALIPILKENPPPFNVANIRRIFRRICKKAKLTGVGWHTFRHTFASHLIMSGVDIVTVSKLLGHSDIKTTMIYSHLTGEHIKDGIAKLDF